MSSYLDSKEFQEYIKNLEEADNDFKNFLRQFLLQMAQRVIANAKPRTPVDTGALKNSFYVGKQGVDLEYNDKGKVTRNLINATVNDIEVVGDSIEVTVGNAMEYASFQEFGYGLKNGGWKNGHFMLTLSIDEIQQQMPDRFEKQFSEFLKNKGVG